MELIHAGYGMFDIQSVTDFSQWDSVAGLGFTYEDNDFELVISEEAWKKEPILEKHHLYEPGTEHGGRVEGVKHIGTTVKLSGPTWRGMIARKYVLPPSGSAYLTITNIDANQFISTLIGSSLGALYSVSVDASGITVSGQYRYDNLLDAIQTTLAKHGARLDISFANGTVSLSAALIHDYSAETEFSQDYSGLLTTETNIAQAYNHIIALGSGLLTARQCVHLYRDDTGAVSTTPFAGLDDRQVIFDYPNAESLADLTTKATAKLLEYVPVKKIEIGLSENQSLKLGDIVGGRDYVTGLTSNKPITQIIRTVNAIGEKIQYKAGV